MSCYSCRKKYGLFTKEVGCPNCGYSYCVKCLKCTAAVPRHGGKELKVCLICFEKLNKSQKLEKVIDVEALPGTILNQNVKSGPIPLSREPPKAAVSLLEDTPPAELGVVLLPMGKANAASDNDSASSEINNNLDVEITKRLKNLKDKLPTTTDGEIRERLSNLTGMPLKDYSNKSILLNTDKRSDEQKTQDLLKEFLSEADLDKCVQSERVDAIADIERRLRALRDIPLDAATSNQSAADANTPSDNEEDDATLLKNIMQKYIAEAALPQVAQSKAQSKANSELEELPWCNICNEDAVVRCIGCDGELFCQQCYIEVHDDDEEYRSHQKEKYTAKPKFEEDHF